MCSEDLECLVASVYPEIPWDISTAFRNAHITCGMFTRQTCPGISVQKFICLLIKNIVQFV